MQHDLVDVGIPTPQEGRGLLRHILVRGTVKPVATDAISLCDSTIQRVDGRRRWQAEEERGVKNRHLRHIREQAPRHLDALYPGRVV
ncbi:Uncharacterised protein [Mycobacteroides abscessus subsp. abscessus]|nr:Uncharacterised protein [Mycobacteroides abscessus subsp. abscessus]